MKWIWQHPDWPGFTFDASQFSYFEREFHRNTGIIVGSLTAVSADEIDELRVALLSAEALETSRIEGEVLDRDSVQSSIRKQLGLQTDDRKVGPKEAGVSKMMVDLYKSYDEPLTQDRLFDWHKMIMNGRIDLDAIGSYRTHEDAMQIVSGRLDVPKVFYEAPPSGSVPDEMKQYIRWFNKTVDTEIPTIVFAGIAHLYFELIHPFEDGNGRIGRSIAEKALGRGARQSLITSLSSTIERDKKAYYHALERANSSLNITEWLIYFCQTVLDSQEYVTRLISFIIKKVRYFDMYTGRLNERQAKVALRIFREGLDGFKGGLSAENYIRITKASRATATRDLTEMVELGALKRVGKLRHTRYYLPFAGHEPL